MNDPSYETINVQKKDIVAGDTTNILNTFNQFISSPETALSWREKVDFTIDGYDYSPKRLCEIPKVRSFIIKLDKQFPFWFFFLTKQTHGLTFVAHCFLPPFTTMKKREKDIPSWCENLLARWYPPMNQICDWIGLPEHEIKAMSERSAYYLLFGPQYKLHQAC